MDNSQQPLFSIIIPTQGGSRIADCIQSVKALACDLNLELIVVAEFSEQLDFIKTKFAEGNWLKLTTSNSPGVSSARNHGLAMAKGQYFILIDDDCDIANWTLLNSIIDKIESNPQVIHGGGYSLKNPASYWAKVYNLTNRIWLERGVKSDGYTLHLLGGFMFAHANLLPKVKFNPELHWGGEEKEMLRNLSVRGTHGILHKDMCIEHQDDSGFKKMIRRAFYHGYVAGRRNLQSHKSVSCTFPAHLILGLGIFYFCSRAGILLGKWDEMKSRKEVTVPTNSPVA